MFAACAPVRPEALPYRYHDGLVDPGPITEIRRPTDARGRGTRRGKAVRNKRTDERGRDRFAALRRRIVQRAEELVDRAVPGGNDAGLLGATLGAPAPAGVLQDVRPEQLHRGDPRPGDLVVFAARGFRRAGVVLQRAGARVTFLFVLDGRARRGALHLTAPDRRRLQDQRRIVNSFIRTKHPDDPPGTRYLAGQLLAGFVRPR